MKTQQYPKRLQQFATCFFLISITLFAGCDFLTGEDDEEPVCEGDVVLINRLHNSTTTPKTVSDPYRKCYTYGLIEQRNMRTITGDISTSNIYIELNGPSIGSGAHGDYHTITLTSNGKDFFEAELANITATFSRLNANKIPMSADYEIIDFEMLKMDPTTRQISFAVNESQYYTSNYTWFVYEPYEIINLVVPENP